MNKLPLVIALIAISPLGELFSATSPVEAKCQPNRSNDHNHYQMGWYRDASPTYGVEAAIENYSPWVQPGINEAVASSAWSMLERPHRWAQIGWLEYPGNERHTFMQYHDSDSIPLVEFADPPFSTGSLTVYKVSYDGSYFRFYAGGALKKTAPATFVPTRAYVSGETHTLATQMPGGYNEDAWLFSSRYQTQLGSNWLDLNGLTWTNSNEFYYHYYGTNWIGIYDRKCAS